MFVCVCVCDCVCVLASLLFVVFVSGVSMWCFICVFVFMSLCVHVCMLLWLDSVVNVLCVWLLLLSYAYASALLLFRRMSVWLILNCVWLCVRVVVCFRVVVSLFSLGCVLACCRYLVRLRGLSFGVMFLNSRVRVRVRVCMQTSVCNEVPSPARPDKASQLENHRPRLTE